MKNRINFLMIGCMLASFHINQCSESKFSNWKDRLGIKLPKEVSKKKINEHQEQPSFGLLENIAIGGFVGAAEIAMPGQMLSYAMNCAIKNEPFVLAKSYAGFTANALGQMPITAMQKIVQVMGSKQLESWQGCSLSERQKIAMSYLAGVAGAVIDTPCNAVQLFLQDKVNAGKTTRQAVKELGAKSFRGFGANAFAKEGLFAVGYQYLAGKTTQAVKPYVGDGIGAAALGGSAAGIVTAIATHPGAVIRNTMQSDLFRDKSVYKNAWQTAKYICRQEGFSGLFKGLKARGARVAIAVPLYVAYTTGIEAKLQHLKK